VTDLVPDVLRHRLVLSYEALADGMSADALVQRILNKVPVPARPLESGHGSDYVAAGHA
jgi:MoxR-like ATPase